QAPSASTRTPPSCTARWTSSGSTEGPRVLSAFAVGRDARHGRDEVVSTSRSRRRATAAALPASQVRSSLVPDADPATVDRGRHLDQFRVELPGYCSRMLGSTEAEDAVQETFIRAWRAYDRFEGRSAFRSWLYRIATNVCFDMLNGRQRRARPIDLG